MVLGNVRQAAAVLVQDNYKYLFHGEFLPADQLQISKLVGRLEGLINVPGECGWYSTATNTKVVAMATCLLTGVAGGRNGIRFAHIAIAEPGQDERFLMAALMSAYDLGL